MGHTSNITNYPQPTTNFYSCFSGAPDPVRKYVLNRDQSVQVRVAQQRANEIRGQENRFIIRRAICRLCLIFSTAMLMAISVRITNHLVYFSSGVDNHILDSVMISLRGLI